MSVRVGSRRDIGGHLEITPSNTTRTDTNRHETFLVARGRLVIVQNGWARAGPMHRYSIQMFVLRARKIAQYTGPGPGPARPFCTITGRLFATTCPGTACTHAPFLSASRVYPGSGAYQPSRAYLHPGCTRDPGRGRQGVAPTRQTGAARSCLWAQQRTRSVHSLGVLETSVPGVLGIWCSAFIPLVQQNTCVVYSFGCPPASLSSPPVPRREATMPP